MTRSIWIYSGAVAAVAFGLMWIDYRYAVHRLSTAGYISLLGLCFAGLGVWFGQRLARRPPAPEFRVNQPALDSLGISPREYQVLTLLAAGHSNQQIADELHVSSNTVKTHLRHLFSKLDVARRTQAVAKAKSLRLIP